MTESLVLLEELGTLRLRVAAWREYAETLERKCDLMNALFEETCNELEKRFPSIRDSTFERDAPKLCTLSKILANCAKAAKDSRSTLVELGELEFDNGR